MFRHLCALLLCGLVLFVSCQLLAKKDPPAEKPTLREELKERMEKERP